MEPLPELGELLRQFKALSPADAESFRPQLAALEAKCAQVQANLVEDEADLAAVEPAPSESAYQQWLLRSSATYGSRYAWRGLAVDAGVLREAMEFALFAAQCSRAPA